jgi:hypothetical protein
LSEQHTRIKRQRKKTDFNNLFMVMFCKSQI